MMKIENELLDIEGIKKSNKPLLELFIRRTAVLTCTQEHLVDKIIKDQWKQANKAIQAGTTGSEVDFCNLGSFFISQSKIKKRIAKLEATNKTITETTEDLENKKKESIIIRNNNSMIALMKAKIK